MDSQNTPTVDAGQEPLLEAFIRQQRATVPTQTPRTSLCLDTCTPFVCPVHVEGPPKPFVFLCIALGLDVWAHDPAAFRRLAEACVAAADALERVLFAPDTRDPADRDADVAAFGGDAIAESGGA